MERRDDFERRLLAGWKHVTAGLAGQPLAIVTHDAVIDCLLDLLTRTPRDRRLPTGCWSQLELDGDRWSAVLVGAMPGDGSRPGGLGV